MKDDGILKELGKAIAHGDYLDDPRWNLLASGLLNEKQKQEFKRDLSTRPDGPDEEQLKSAWAAFSPLSRQTNQALKGLFESREKVTTWTRLVGWMTHNPHRLAVAGVGLLGAVLVLLSVVRQAQSPSSDFPSYSLEFSGGDVVSRAEPAKVRGKIAKLSPGSMLRLTLRPKTRVPESVDVEVIGFLVSKNKVTSLILPVRISKEGTVSIQGQVSQLLGIKQGLYRMVFAVGRKGDSIPRRSFLLKMRSDGNLDQWQVFVIPVELIGR